MPCLHPEVLDEYSPCNDAKLLGDPFLLPIYHPMIDENSTCGVAGEGLPNRLGLIGLRWPNHIFYIRGQWMSIARAMTFN